MSNLPCLDATAAFVDVGSERMYVCGPRPASRLRVGRPKYLEP